MRGGRIADWLAAEWLADFRGRPCWLGLASEDPEVVTDPLTVEVGGSVYRRPPIVWLFSERLLRNRDPLTWLGLPVMTRIVALVGFDAPFNGRYVFTRLLPAPIDLPAGGSYTVPARELFFGIGA